MSRFAVDLRPRCRQCRKLLAEKVTRPWVIGCGRCKTTNRDDDQGLPRKVVLIDDVQGGEQWSGCLPPTSRSR